MSSFAFAGPDWIEDGDEVSGPDNEGGNNPISSWIGQGIAGNYEIVLHGVGTVPAPTA